MPIYDFKCKNDHIVEEIAGFEDIRIICPICKENADRIFGVGFLAFDLKGMGYYMKHPHKKTK